MDVLTPRGIVLEAAAVTIYLSAIVIANLVVAWGGQQALVITGFFLIPLDLVTRDILHERWHGTFLWLRMAALIASGSIIAFAFNADSWRVGLASFLAFGAAGFTNTAIYGRLWHRSRMVRMNGSNAGAAIVDSLVFPVVAFFPELSVLLMLAQAALKFLGGFMWSAMYVSIRRRFDR